MRSIIKFTIDTEKIIKDAGSIFAYNILPTLQSIDGKVKYISTIYKDGYIDKSTVDAVKNSISLNNVILYIPAEILNFVQKNVHYADIYL